MIPWRGYLLADPFNVSTQGVEDSAIGIATSGWVIDSSDPSCRYHKLDKLFQEPDREWWIRRDNTDEWYGPLSYAEADSKARLMSRDVDNTISEVKYAQMGTIIGNREGDPQVEPHMVVAYIFVNGKMSLAGRMAEFHKNLYPV